MPGLIFFDVDGTIIHGNTGMLAVRFLREHGQLSRLAVARGAYYGFLHYVNLLDWEKMFRQAVQPFVGMTEDEVRDLSVQAFDADIRKQVYPQARSLIEEQLRRGDVVCLISSSSPYLVEPLARDLGVEHSITSGPAVENGIITDRLSGTACYGEGKVTLAREFCDARGFTLDNAVFHADSTSDLPLLQAVGTPVATNPTRLLRREARKRRWTIVDFEPPD